MPVLISSAMQWHFAALSVMPRNKTHLTWLNMIGKFEVQWKKCSISPGLPIACLQAH